MSPFRTYTILVPSGDQSGLASPSGVLVRFVCPVPSEFMTWMSPFLTKTILAPSGDQPGSVSPSGVLVRFVCPPPAAPMIQMSPATLPSLKAIFVPSAHHAGTCPPPLVRLETPLPSGFMV